MSHWNMPPGVSTNDIPGNEPERNEMNWVTEVKDLIDKAISDKTISKEELAEGLEDIEDHAGEWARQLRDELKRSE